MKINKFILEDFLTLSSIISLLLGSTVFSLGIIGVSIIEIEKVLNYQPPISEKIGVFSIATGAAGFGFGLLLMQASIFVGKKSGKIQRGIFLCHVRAAEIIMALSITEPCLYAGSTHMVLIVKSVLIGLNNNSGTSAAFLLGGGSRKRKAPSDGTLKGWC